MMNYEITLTAQICALRHPNNKAALYSCEAAHTLEMEVRTVRGQNLIQQKKPN